MEKNVIVQISDIHCGSSLFRENIMKKVIHQVNELKPDLLVITGDLTMDGYYEEYRMALKYISQFKIKKKIIVPGNHDARNVGYKTFEKLIGNPFKCIKLNNNQIIICGVDSTEPDLDDGQLGRYHTMKLKRIYSRNYKFKALALHHHVISVPNSGREMNILRDAGDVLKMAVKSKLNLIMSGHKHIPNLWNFEGIKVLTCATTTDGRIRGIYKNSYNIITITNKLKIEKREVEGGTVTLYEGSL